jgi:hypothetical protein
MGGTPKTAPIREDGLASHRDQLTLELAIRKRGRRITLLCAGGLVPDVVVTAEDGTAWQSALRSFTGGRCQKLVRVIVRAAGAWFQS